MKPISLLWIGSNKRRWNGKRTIEVVWTFVRSGTREKMDEHSLHVLVKCGAPREEMKMSKLDDDDDANHM